METTADPIELSDGKIICVEAILPRHSRFPSTEIRTDTKQKVKFLDCLQQGSSGLDGGPVASATRNFSEAAGEPCRDPD